MHNARKISIDVGNSKIDCAVFGKGSEALVILPGLSTNPVSGFYELLSELYASYGEDFTVYFVDRKEKTEENYSISDMADDTVRALKKAGVNSGYFYGISQGGMIAQLIAAKYPETVKKLALASTLLCADENAKKVIGKWASLAEKGDYQALNNDFAEMIYTEEYRKKYEKMLSETSKTPPADPEHFIILAKACLSFDASNEAEKIKCPALVLGGKEDKVISVSAIEKLAKALSAEIFIYENYGHAVYDESDDIKQRVLDFFKK